MAGAVFKYVFRFVPWIHRESMVLAPGTYRAQRVLVRVGEDRAVTIEIELDPAEVKDASDTDMIIGGSQIRAR